MSDLATIAAADLPLTRLTPRLRRNLALASLGSMLEFYEFMVFGFFTAVIGNLFFPPTLPDSVKTFQAFALYSLGFILRPVSGAILGYFGDRYGRKRLFLLTVALMALPTTLIGLLPTYASIGLAAPILLLVLRIVQGVALAGEFAGASIFMTEHSPPQRAGFGSGVLLGSSYIGFFLGAGTGAFLTAILPAGALESWAWRVPFIVGGLFGLVSTWLRRRMDETPLFLELRARRADALRVPVPRLIRDYWPATLFDVGIGVYLGTMIIILYFYMPTLLQTQFGVDRGTVFNANSLALFVLAVACPIWGMIGDRIGHGAVLTLGVTLLGLALLVFFSDVPAHVGSGFQLGIWWIAFSLFMSSAAVIPALCALVFPPEVRFTGFGFAYNIGSVISALAPTIMAALVIAHGTGSVLWYALATCILGAGLGVWALVLPTYSGREIAHAGEERG